MSSRLALFSLSLTYYKHALQAFEKQIKTNRVGIYSKSWVLGVIISDGEPTDNLDVTTLLTQTIDFEKLIAYVNYLKQNATLMVVLVGDRYSGAKVPINLSKWSYLLIMRLSVLHRAI